MERLRSLLSTDWLSLVVLLAAAALAVVYFRRRQRQGAGARHPPVGRHLRPLRRGRHGRRRRRHLPLDREPGHLGRHPRRGRRRGPLRHDPGAGRFGPLVGAARLRLRRRAGARPGRLPQCHPHARARRRLVRPHPPRSHSAGLVAPAAAHSRPRLLQLSQPRRAWPGAALGGARAALLPSSCSSRSRWPKSASGIPTRP